MTARISSFNDPFEFLYVYAATITPEQALNEVRQKVTILNQLFPNPLNGQEIEKLLPSIAEDLVKSFEKSSALSLERRKQIIDEELRAITTVRFVLG